MKSILIILGSQSGEFAAGKYNFGLFEATKNHLSPFFYISTTIIEDSYQVKDEISKWKQADYIIYQYPICWFMMPSGLKKYLDDVYANGEFFSFEEEVYGSGGLMQGKSVMLSTTWSTPEEAFGTDLFDGADRDAVLLPMRKSQTYCGMEELPHFSVHDIVKRPNFERDKSRLISHLNRVFSLR